MKVVISSCSINEIFSSKWQGASIGCVYKAVGNSEGAQTPGVCMPGLDSHSLPSPALLGLVRGGVSGNTITSWRICCWDLVVHRAQWSRLGVIMVCGFPAECSGISCPAALALSVLPPRRLTRLGSSPAPGGVGEIFIVNMEKQRPLLDR